MGHFYFNVLNDAHTTLDREGLEMANLDAACQHARAIIGEIIADELGGGANTVHISVLIDDENHLRAANIKSLSSIVESLSPLMI